MKKPPRHPIPDRHHQSGQLQPKLLIIVAAVALALGGAGWFMAAKDTTDANPGANAAVAAVKANLETGALKPALTITTTQPSTASLAIKLAANGNVAAWQEASVGAEASGLRLTQVLVNVGDAVKKGQLLATFAGDAVQADVAQAKAALMEAEANAADAKANAERARTLQNTGALSTQQINQYLTAEKTAAARVQASQATLNAQAVRTQNTQVRAPDNGVISSRSATVGAVVGAGAELFRMIRGGRLEWRAEVTSAELGRVKPGTMATVIAADGSSVQGRVRMVAPTVDPQTRAALVYVDLPANPSIKAGMFAKGEFVLGNSSALTVAQSAVVIRDGFSYVFKVGADHRVTQTKVQTGRRVGSQVEVLQGLKADNVVAASGAGFLNDGDLVKVVATAAIPAPAPATTTVSATAPVMAK
ncbi:MAG: efflux RND transporter periplasmic adaptor subunit [Burkholderiaceae bacterium]|nr:efflux RND transporter periplasmic adaptor subunit [Burkholderiaceae bacterium]